MLCETRNDVSGQNASSLHVGEAEKKDSYMGQECNLTNTEVLDH